MGRTVGERACAVLGACTRSVAMLVTLSACATSEAPQASSSGIPAEHEGAGADAGAVDAAMMMDAAITPDAASSPVDRMPVVRSTAPIATVVGAFRPLVPGDLDIGFYAADLGWTFRHGDELWILFGDSWSDPFATSLLVSADDALGKIPLAFFPDGAAVERWLAINRPPPPLPAWLAPGPPLGVALDANLRAVPIRQVSNGVVLTSAHGLTPIAGFSNGRRDDGAGVFGIFLRNEPVACSDAGTCADGLSCDEALGRCAPVNDLSAVCVLGTKSCQCVRDKAPRGMCQDRTSSLYDARSERGRVGAVVMRHQVGNALRGVDTLFTSQPWDTHRFFSATVATVDDFDPRRIGGVGNDYRLADGRERAREGVFVWGRPGFGGIGREGRDAQLYLAWVPMPAYDPAGQFAWQPRYFAGLDEDGRPRFVAREVDATPLDLDATRAGEQPEEPLDIVGQMAISWVPGLERYVMFYGGDMGEQFLDLIFGPDRAVLARDPLGAIYVRYAAHPWGPWTPPTPVLIAGAPELGVPGQYGPGGILHDPGCTGTLCTPSETALLGERGRLYGPSIIDPWTTLREGAVDLYWHVSTWNPYQVILMRTTLQLP